MRSVDTPKLSEDAAALFQLLSILVRIPSVVGAETPFMRALERELVLRGAKVRHFQGLLEASGDDPDSSVVSAHVDRHGLVCTGPMEYQYAAFVAKSQGDLDGNSISEQTAATVIARFQDATVEAYDPWHGGYLTQGTIRRVDYCEQRRNLVFELDSVGVLRPGTPLAYLQPLVVGVDTLSAQLDNVLSVAVLVDMFRRGFRGTALFSAEEEAGRSWRYIQQWYRRRGQRTRRLIVMDTSPYPDADAASAQDIVLRHKDANGSFDQELISVLTGLCKDNGAIFAFKDTQIEQKNLELVELGKTPVSLGRTELGRLVTESGGEINGATLQLPTVGYHTPQETVRIHSLEAMIRITEGLMNL